MTRPTPHCDAPPAPAEALAVELNRRCRCVTLDEAVLARGLAAAVDDPALLDSIRREQPHLFSATTVFATSADVARMQAVIEAVERAVALPAFRERTLAWAPAIARFDPGPRGVFLGYDFHLGPGGPQLIEINTNAGGAALNAALARAQRACCRDAQGCTSAASAGRAGAAEVEDFMTAPTDPAQAEEGFIAMFREEWRRQRGDAPLKTVAIVDDRPAEQYLYPEFRLFEALFRRHGIDVVIADAADLMVCHGNLWHADTRIDLVYNRLTDFSLAEPGTPPCARPTLIVRRWSRRTRARTRSMPTSAT